MSGMQTCSKCGGAVFPPGIAVGWGGQTCHCGTQYDLQLKSQIQSGLTPYTPWQEIIRLLNLILEKLENK